MGAAGASAQRDSVSEASVSALSELWQMWLAPIRWGRRATNVQVYRPVLVIRPERITLGLGARVDSFVKIEGGQGVTIGDYVHVASFCHLNIGGGVLVIGDGAAIASGARILSGSNLMTGRSCSAAAPRAWQVVERERTIIGANAFIGAGATVMPGVTIAPGAAIGAGAVVMHDVPAYEVWAGVPARKIGERPR